MAKQKRAGKQEQAGKQKQVGKITHYYSDIGVGVVKVAAAFSKGDNLLIGKNEPYRKQEALSMQLNHQAIEKTRKGQEIGLKVSGKVREGDKVFKLS